MVYYIVPVNSGLLDIDYLYLQEGVQASATECYVKLRDGAELRSTWQEITEEQFEQAKASME